MPLKTECDSNGRTRLRWTCPLCIYELRFHAHDAGEVAFFVVRHLSGVHALAHSDMRLLEPELGLD